MSKWVEEKVQYFIQKHLKADSTLIRPFSKLLTEIFQNELEFQNKTLKKSCKQLRANAPNQKHAKKVSRKLSDYVQFCRYMKKHFPEKKNLQSIWKNPNIRVNWKSVEPQELIQKAETELIIQPNMKFKLKYQNMLAEFKMMAELDDPQETLMNIHREACYNKKINFLTLKSDEELEVDSDFYCSENCSETSELIDEVDLGLNL